jgi:hypothetical protein
MEAYMESIVTLTILAGVLCVSISLGLMLEAVLVEGIFKLLPQAATELSRAPRHMHGTVQARGACQAWFRLL